VLDQRQQEQRQEQPVPQALRVLDRHQPMRRQRKVVQQEPKLVLRQALRV